MTKEEVLAKVQEIAAAGGADWRGHRHGAWAAGWLL